jgi:hypothetical protein
MHIIQVRNKALFSVEFSGRTVQFVHKHLSFEENETSDEGRPVSQYQKTVQLYAFLKVEINLALLLLSHAL